MQVTQPARALGAHVLGIDQCPSGTLHVMQVSFHVYINWLHDAQLLMLHILQECLHFLQQLLLVALHHTNGLPLSSST